MRRRISPLRNSFVLLLLLTALLFGYGPVNLAVQEWQVYKPEASKVTATIITKSFSGITPRTAMAAVSEKVLKVPTQNTLQIPGIGVNTPILEGSSINILNKGIWRRPASASPGNGNMVLAGHRYMWKSGPDTFYHLPKLSKGDLVRVFWQGGRYDYEVRYVYNVSESATDIEADTGEDVLTLYTCTLLTSKERVVVKAYPVREPEFLAVVN